MKLDTNTSGYLSLFDLAQDAADGAIRQLDYLGDVRKCPASALKYHFMENGLVYPDFPEVTPALLRSILIDSEILHARRYTLRGLVDYVQHFEDIGVAVAVTDAESRQLWLSVTNWGLPNVEALASTASTFDECYYLYKDQQLTVIVTLDGGATAAMVEFFTNTLKYELPFGMADICTIQVVVA